MPLVKQSYSLALATGIDTKSDPKQIQGKSLLLENGIFVSPGRIKKRPGYASLDTKVLSNGATISSTGIIIPSVLDSGWPISTSQTVANTPLTVVTPAVSPPGGPRLVYATILWKTYNWNLYDPNAVNEPFWDAWGSTVGATPPAHTVDPPVAFWDSNGVTWHRIAYADFGPYPELTQGHHGAELWAAWYPGQVPAGTTISVWLPNMMETPNYTTPGSGFQYWQGLLTVYSRYNTADGSGGVANCFGNIATYYNTGSGNDAWAPSTPRNLTPIDNPLSIGLTLADTTSAAVIAVLDGYYANNVPRTALATTRIDAQDVTNTAQVSASLTAPVRGLTTVGLTGNGAWNNILAAEILGGTGVQYNVAPGASNVNVSAAKALFTHADQLLLHDGRGLYSWGAADNAWFFVEGRGGLGIAPALTVSAHSVIKNSGFQAHPDVSVHPSGYACLVYEDTIIGGVRYTVLDNGTGAPLYFDQPIPTTAGINFTTTYAPKVISYGKWILVFYTSTAADSSSPGGTRLCLYVTGFDTTNPFQGFGAPRLVHGNFPADATKHFYDVTIVGTTLVVAAVAQGSYAISLFGTTSPTTGTPASWTFAQATISTVAQNALTIFPDSIAGNVVCAWCDGTNVKFAIYAANPLTQMKTPATISAEAPCNITGAAILGSTPNIKLFWTIPATPTDTATPMNYRTRVASITGAPYSVSAAADLLRSVGLCGKAFAVNGVRYVPVAYEGGTQMTNFLSDEAGNIVAKMLPGAGIGQLWGASNGQENSLLPECTLSGNTVYLAMQERFGAQGLKVLGQVTATPGTTIAYTTSAGVTMIGLQFGTDIQRASLANDLHFGGGLVFMYDGANGVEHGFHVYPESVSVPSPGGDARYYYCVCYEWMDLQGNQHRSAPSPAVQQAQAATIDGTHGVQVTIPTLRLTGKQFSSSVYSRKPVTCTVYRTENLGTVFHRVNQTIAATANDTTVDTIIFTDTTTDDELRSNPLLYTTGGVLDNTPPPSPAYMADVQNRLWVIDSTNALSLWYSKEVVPGSPVEFSDYLRWNLTPRGPKVGGATALALLDDKRIVFREGGISVLVGQGPDSLGAQNDFREIQLPEEVGCIEPKSVIHAGDGILFRSAKGFYKLDRTLNTSYVGAAVEAFNDQHVTSATLLPRTHWAVMTLSNGTALMYDYQFNEWSVFPGINAVDGGVYQDLHAWVDAGGIVRQQTLGGFTDDGAYIPMKLKTAWVQLAGLQGFKRIWQLLFIGDWISSHRLQVDLAYDFDGTIVQQTDTVVLSTTQRPLQFRVQCKVQQCQAIQITITELPPVDGTAYGEGLTLSAVLLDVGLKPGAFRLPASKTVG